MASMPPAEAEVKGAGVGLWAEPGAQPPWEWRNERRKK